MLYLNLDIEKKLLETEITNWFDRTKNHLTLIPISLSAQVKLLNTIRKDIYEDINQLQHKALLISAVELLKIEFPQINKWSWFPKQTSHPEFADLTGYVNEEIFLNAEATTSNKPLGTVDRRMIRTLYGLNNKVGLKYYFVQSEEMFQRAKSKIIKNNFNINARII